MLGGQEMVILCLALQLSVQDSTRPSCSFIYTCFALYSLVCVSFAAKNDQQKKQQHPDFWLPNISHCKPLLAVSSHFPEPKSRPLTYSRPPSCLGTNILEGFC